MDGDGRADCRAGVLAIDPPGVHDGRGIGRGVRGKFNSGCGTVLVECPLKPSRHGSVAIEPRLAAGDAQVNDAVDRVAERKLGPVVVAVGEHATGQLDAARALLEEHPLRVSLRERPNGEAEEHGDSERSHAHHGIPPPGGLLKENIPRFRSVGRRRATHP